MMKNTLCLLALFFVACSAPKYTTVDQFLTPASASSHAPENDSFAFRSGNIVASNRPTPAPVEKVATVTPPALAESATVAAPANFTKADKKKARQQLKSVVRELKQNKKAANPSSTAQGVNPRNNGFAIAGFVLSIVGWFVLWPLVIVGIIFSAIGLNSEKRGFAIAGIVIGIVGLVLLLLASQNGGIA